MFSANYVVAITEYFSDLTT